MDDQPQNNAPQDVTYVEGFDDPNANVVLMGSDKRALRVHDYFLKAASPFFRDMLEAGTKGGPVPLEASSRQLKFMMERLTTGNFQRPSLQDLSTAAPDDAYQNDYENLSNLIEMHHIAEKYILEDISSGIRQLIARFAYEHAPMTLVFACHCKPANKLIVQAALHAFGNRLDAHMVGHYFKGSYRHTNGAVYASPLFDNVARGFARDLGGEALLAYARALAGAFGHMSTSEWNDAKGDVAKSHWTKVADLFLRELGIQKSGRIRGVYGHVIATEPNVTTQPEQLPKVYDQES